MSFIVALTNESVEELSRVLRSREYYVGPGNEMYYGASNDVSTLVFKSMSRN